MPLVINLSETDSLDDARLATILKVGWLILNPNYKSISSDILSKIGEFAMTLATVSSSSVTYESPHSISGNRYRLFKNNNSLNIGSIS